MRPCLLIVIASLPKSSAIPSGYIFRFALSFRDIEEKLAQRKVVRTCETIRAWCRKFGQTYAKRDLSGEAISGTLTMCSSRSTEAFITYDDVQNFLHKTPSKN
jgi:putative transposase